MKRILLIAAAGLVMLSAARAEEGKELLRAESYGVKGQEPPLLRKKSDVEAILKGAPKPEGKLTEFKILLVAGPKDHGVGEHDYPAWQKKWAPLLAKGEVVKVDTAFGWPTEEQWKWADVAAIFLKTAWTDKQMADVKGLQDRGGGVVLIHWAISPDVREKGKFSNFEKHAELTGLTYTSAKYRHGAVDLKIVAPEKHVITAGLPKMIHFVDEPYWPFIGEAFRVTVLATSDEKLSDKDEKATAVPVFWTYEPKKGRAFVSIFGHYSWTLDDPMYRVILLRGICWAGSQAATRLDGLAMEGVRLAE